MTYKEVIDYLYSRLPMYSRIGAAAYKKDLTRTKELCAMLNHPEQKLKCIHIAGTNGKGSVTHMIAAGLIASGFKVGIYTSPHYKDFRERIKINRDYISKKYITRFINQHREKIEQIEPSFFELTFAMAVDYFAFEKVDYVVVETGLGGRLDSTNVVHPILSVITNISWDHMDMLGDTLEKIAAEKAGIIKYKVPILIGRRQKETHTIFSEKAKELKSDLTYAEDNYKIISSDQEVEINRTKRFAPDQLGPYQLENYRTAYAALQLLVNSGIQISDESIKFAFENVATHTGFIGRWQWKKSDRRLLMDSAHNLDGIKYLMDWIKTQEYLNLHVVCGFVKDKSLDAILSIMLKNARYYFTQAKIPRALPSKELQMLAQKFELKGKAYTSVSRALSSAQRKSDKDDLIIVCGSIFVVAEVL